MLYYEREAFKKRFLSRALFSKAVKTESLQLIVADFFLENSIN